jgi:hypothetical protein
LESCVTTLALLGLASLLIRTGPEMPSRKPESAALVPLNRLSR